MVDAADLEDVAAGIRAVLDNECNRQALHAHVDGRVPLEDRLWRQGAELGWPAIALAEWQGGIGAGPAGLWVLHRELGAHLAPGPWLSVTVAALALATAPVAAAFPGVVGWPDRPGDEPQRLGQRDGKLEGELHGMLGPQQSTLVLAPVRDGDRDVWALLHLPDAGIELRSDPAWDHTRSLGSLRCTGTRAFRLLPATESERLQAALRRHLHLALAADSLGGAQALLDQTVRYLGERVQFGKPIGSFQALKHRAADLKLRLEQARHLGEQALDAAVADRADAGLWCALAKAAATDAYVAIAADAIQLHGGIGFTWEHEAHLFLKRARLNQALGGDNARLRDEAAQALLQVLAGGGSAMEMAA